MTECQNQTFLNRDIMRSLLTCKAYDTSVTPKKDIVFKQIVSVAPLSIAEDFDLIGEKTLLVNAVSLLDGCDCCFIADIKGWDSRGVDRLLRSQPCGSSGSCLPNL